MLCTPCRRRARRVPEGGWRSPPSAPLQFPALQLCDGFLEGTPFLVAARFRPQSLVRPDREIERDRIMLGSGEARRVVRQRGPGQLVSGKPLGHLLPSLDATARVGFTQRPEVPRTAIGVVRGHGACGECPDDVRAPTGQPVCAREDDHCLGVVRAGPHDALVGGYDDLRQVVVRSRRGDQHVRVGRNGKLLHALQEYGDVAIVTILLDGAGNGGLHIHFW